jgi:HK97 family phage portal protein
VFKEALQANATLWGKCYARIEVNNAGDPIALRPLMSSQVVPERVAGQLRYSVRNGQGGRFAPEEMLVIPAMSLNGVVGLSPIAYCREAIATGKAAEIFGSTFFGNGANLRGVLSFPDTGRLTPEQIRAVRESFDAQYGGVGNANKTGIIPFGGTYSPIGVPPDDAQFLETRQFSIQEVARIYRIPPHMLGDLSRSTNNNIEQSSLEFLIYTLLPWIEKWEQELTRKLCGGTGEYHVKFDTKRMLRTDTAARQKFYESGLQWGYLNPDSCRAMENLGPLPDGLGQIYRSPVNMEPMEVLAKTAEQGYRPTAPGAVTTPPTTLAPGETDDKPSKVRQLRPFLVDALNRMQRKEMNAIARGKASDDFYEDHGRHVREAMLPVLIAAMGQGTKLETAMPVISAVADARHASDPAWINSSETDAETIIRAIEEIK